MASHIGNKWFSSGRFTSALLLRVALLIWLANSFFIQARTIIYYHDQADIAAYYAAAEVKRTAAGSIYDTNQLNHLGAQRGIETQVRPYIYPPLLAEALAPMAILPYDLFRLVFLAGMHVLLGALFFVIVGLVKRHSPGHQNENQIALVTLLVLVVSSSLERDLFTGQVNILLTLAVAAAFLLDSRRHYLAVGLLIALGTLVKLFFVVFLLYYLFHRRFKVVLTAGVAIVLFVAASVAVFGADDWITYATRILPSFASQIYPSDVHEHVDLTTSNYSVLSFLYLLTLGFGSTIPLETLTLMHKIASVLVLAVVGSVFWAGRRLQRSPIAEMQLILCATMLIAPIVWSHWFIYLIPGYVYAFCHLLRGGLTARESLLLVASFSLIALADYGPNMPFFNHGPLLLLKPLKLYGLVMFTGFLAKLYLRGLEAVRADETPSEAA